MATYGVVVVCLMVVLSNVSFGLAKDYTVGDTAGWALSVDYTKWANGKTFKVGDSLGKRICINSFTIWYIVKG
ncbi:putative Phytocyanin domain, cupredoxin [Helianthus anomalus]